MRSTTPQERFADLLCTSVEHNFAPPGAGSDDQWDAFLVRIPPATVHHPELFGMPAAHSCILIYCTCFHSVFTTCHTQGYNAAVRERERGGGGREGEGGKEGLSRKKVDRQVGWQVNMQAERERQTLERETDRRTDRQRKHREIGIQVGQQTVKTLKSSPTIRPQLMK